MTLPTDKSWKFYGKRAPYFGVFGQAEFLNENLDPERLDYYFKSGESYVEDLFNLIHKKIDPDYKPQTILDFGCGPGRMLIPFCNYAREVTGMDISREMLAEAEKNCRERNISNAVFLLSDDELSQTGAKKFDLVHSFIVLQHLDVRRGEKILEKLLDKIDSNGIGVLHLTYHDNHPGRKMLNLFRSGIPYFARILRIFRHDPVKKQLQHRPHMQMNSYDLNGVFMILQRAGIKEVISNFTNHHEYWGVILAFKK
jgi:ubiquinone/menaquinone biosynthesis C-methylase UbiE